MLDMYILKLTYCNHIRYLEFNNFDSLLNYLKPFIIKFRYNENFSYVVYKGAKILNNDYLYGSRKELYNNEI